MDFTWDKFTAGLEKAVRIIKLEPAAAVEVADDEESLPIGLAIVAISGLIAWLPAFPVGLVAGPVFAVVGSFVGVGILYLLGLLFGLNWDFLRLYRGISFTWLLSWAGIVNVVPLLGQVLMLAVLVYQMVVSVIVVEAIGPTERGKAIAIVVLPTVVCCAVAAMAMFAFGAAILAAIGMEGMQPR